VTQNKKREIWHLHVSNTGLTGGEKKYKTGVIYFHAATRLADGNADSSEPGGLHEERESV